jgi:hypothetical protein
VADYGDAVCRGKYFSDQQNRNRYISPFQDFLRQQFKGAPVQGSVTNKFEPRLQISPFNGIPAISAFLNHFRRLSDKNVEMDELLDRESGEMRFIAPDCFAAGCKYSPHL